MPTALLILQAGTAAVMASPAPPALDLGPPTIELQARVHADSIRVERQGDAHLRVYADPVLAKAINVQRSKPIPNGATVRNVEVVLDANVAVDPNGGPASASIQATTPGELQP